MFRFLRRGALLLVVFGVGVALFGLLPGPVQTGVAWVLLAYLVRCAWGQLIRDFRSLTGRVPRGRHGGFSVSRSGSGDL